MEKRRIATLAAGLLLAVLPAAAGAQPTVFTRVNQSAGFSQWEFAFSYGLEAKRGLAEYRKSEGGGGGGGGLGGRQDYAGVNHRLAAALGLTDWMTISIEQTLKQPELDELEYGVLVPELRLCWTDLSPALAGRVPFELSTFVASHVRVNARRRSSLVLGVGADRTLGDLRLGANAAFETTLDSEQRENGLRYQLGASYALPWSLAVALEAWGAMVWPDEAVFQQDHHGGPSVRFKLGPFWAGVNLGFGMKERPAKVFVDLSTMARLGVKF